MHEMSGPPARPAARAWRFAWPRCASGSDATSARRGALEADEGVWKMTEDDVPRGPLGDARPTDPDWKEPTPGGQPPEPVEDRPRVGETRPEAYPDRHSGEAAANRGKRRSKGSGPVSGSGAGAGGGGNPEDYDSDAAGGGGADPLGKTIGEAKAPKRFGDAPVGGSR
ncbi:hypothetical protein CPA46_07755 [Sphingopyxis terrae subsp. ummariensis]|nr:hypothetical protein CPA46_07755 [Sphingopyxis terrae subsp. ummariensis]